MAEKIEDLFEFGEFRLEGSERRLRKGEEVLSTPPKVFDLLLYLVQNAGRLITKEELIAALWPDAFVEEANLSVNVSALRRLLGDGAAEARYIETVPKRGYRFIAPVSVPAAPATPVELPVASPAPALTPTGLRWIALAAVSLLGIATWLTMSRRVPATPESIAVLPFLATGPAAGSKPGEAPEYLGLGIADAITTRLAALKPIEVRSTSRVSRFTAPGRDPLAIAKSLAVDAVLDGRVQMVGERLRITAQLLRARDGHQLWAQTFDDDFSKIFRVQDEIADQIARALNTGAASTVTKRSTSNAQAYQHYLQGQFLASKRLHAATESAIDSFEKAIALDPSYPLPYAALAQSYLIRAGEGWGGTLRDRAKTAALRAISLDDQSAESQLALGQVLMRSEWDWAGAERAFRRAVALNGDLDQAHAALSTLWTALGRHEEAIQEIRTACRLHPEAVTWQADLAWTLLFAGRSEEAVLEGQRAIGLDAWSYSARRQLGKAYLFTGKHAEAVEESRRALEINGSRRQRALTEWAKALAVAKRPADVKLALTEIGGREWQEPYPHYEMAVLQLELGSRDEAVRQLALALEKRISRVIWMREDPELAPLRTDPRFQKLLDQLHLPR